MSWNVDEFGEAAHSLLTAETLRRGGTKSIPESMEVAESTEGTVGATSGYREIVAAREDSARLYE
jgi:hypothetical protein